MIKRQQNASTVYQQKSWLMDFNALKRLCEKGILSFENTLKVAKEIPGIRSNVREDRKVGIMQTLDVSILESDMQEMVY